MPEARDPSNDDTISKKMQAASPHLTQLLAHLIQITQVPPPEKEQDINPFIRTIGSSSLEVVSVFLKNSGLAPDYISLPLKRLAIELQDINKDTVAPIFRKLPNIRKSPDPTMLWLFRAEAAALLKVLVEQKFAAEKDAALQIYKGIEKWVPKVTGRSLDKRNEKEKPAEKAIPSKVIGNWLAPFEDAEAALKAEAEKAAGKKVAVDEKALAFANINSIAMGRFRNHCRGLLEQWQGTPERERAAWVQGRIRKLQERLKLARI